MSTMNGMMFGNLPGLQAEKDDAVRWYSLSLGNEVRTCRCGCIWVYMGVHSCTWVYVGVCGGGRKLCRGRGICMCFRTCVNVFSHVCMCVYARVCMCMCMEWERERE
jgi:hypothetical protein